MLHGVDDERFFDRLFISWFTIFDVVVVVVMAGHAAGLRRCQFHGIVEVVVVVGLKNPMKRSRDFKLSIQIPTKMNEFTGKFKESGVLGDDTLLRMEF